MKHSNTYTSSQPGLAGKFYFEVHHFDWLRQNNIIEAFKAERLPFYEINIFLSSTGDFKVDSVLYPVDGRAIYCLVPGQLRNYHSTSMEGYRICFSADYLHLGSAHTRIAPWLDIYNPQEPAAIVETDDDMKAELLEIIHKMEREVSNFYMHRSEILAGLLNIMLIHFSRNLRVKVESNTTNDARLLRRFKTSLVKNYASKKQVIDYAEEMCVSANYLNRTVKRMTGFTASHHIQQQIVMEAKRHAIHSGGSMKEIAYVLGFDNLAHFSKFFKNNCGMNFTSFKKETGSAI